MYCTLLHEGLCGLPLQPSVSLGCLQAAQKTNLGSRMILGEQPSKERQVKNSWRKSRTIPRAPPFSSYPQSPPSNEPTRRRRRNDTDVRVDCRDWAAVASRLETAAPEAVEGVGPGMVGSEGSRKPKIC